MTRDYKGLTNEELVSIIRGGDENALGQLFENLKPAMVKEANKYQEAAPYMDTDDYIQEGCILVWKIIWDDKYKGGKFFSYFYTAYRNRLTSLYWEYKTKNPMVEVSRHPDVPELGYSIVTFEESKAVEAYREKRRQSCREAYHRRKEREKEERIAAGLPMKEKLTPEQRAERKRQQAREYYYRNRDSLNRKRVQKRRAGTQADMALPAAARMI